MEFHQLKDFVTVANTRSFSGAAVKCKITQPSLSKAILKLKAEIGEKLFLRTKRGTVLTSAGETLLKRAVRILNEMESAKREINETKSLRRGTVNISILPTISPYFLPEILAQFHADLSNPRNHRSGGNHF